MPYADPEQRRQRDAARYLQNRESRLAANREQYQRTRDQRDAATRAWREANPQAVRAIHFANKSNTRARRWSDSTQKVFAKDLLRDLPLTSCTYCGEQAETWDHVVPLCDGGDNALSNLTPTCHPCNRKKGRRNP